MERRIEIRTIGGESTTVLISPDRWVRDLKALLRESFSTAIKSPNFHLFLKGAKLDLNSRIDSQQIKEGEFIVLVPFVKKSQKLSSQQYPVDQSFRPSMPPGENLASQTADSTWLDTMNDISSIAHTLHRSGISGMEKVEEPQDECPAKRKKLSGSYDAIHDLLSSGSKDVFDHQICGKICELVESIKCFSNPITGNCLLLEHFAEKSLNTEQCACPLWLKRVLKAFTLLNVLYAFFYRQNKSVTWNLLEQVLKQSSIFGLDNLSTSFVEKLSLVSPKVIIILGNGQKVATPQGLAIIIGDMSTNASDQPEFKKEQRNARQKSIFVITKAVEKRMETFRTDLWKLIRCFMENQLSKAVSTCMPSLEDIINMRDHVTIPECSNIKKAKSGAAVQRCCGTNLLEPTEMVDHLQKGLGISGQIVHIEEINPKLATHVDIPDSLADVLKEALLQIGITRLYDHQAEALQSSLSGKHVVIATSTSSGKSLCYNMRVVEALSTDMTACALYMFPTKALAQDQKRAFVEMTSGFDFGLNVSIYDGDTSQKHRKWIENNARVLITNPDMLHLSILPYHTKFQRIFANLRIIVVDEAHIYKGAFGCHTSLILRRLKRICLHVYGCDPLFIFCTATLANPREHTMELGNLQNVELILNDGSPCGAKHFVLWNPPFRTEATRSERKIWNGEFSNRRISPILETSYLFAELVQHGLRCIAFCKTRKLSELVLCYTREILLETASDLMDSICVYRGGYTPQDRRRIEADLFAGKLRGVAATNALELGIDVGYIDATLHLGFPGSVASLWQQAGRCGRRSRPSLSICIAFEGPLDQYFMKFPDKLFRKSVEYCHVDSHNEKVLEQHLACAALELPLCSQYDENHFGACLERAISSLKNKGFLATASEVSATKIWRYIGPEEKPSTSFSIRAIESNKYQVISKESNQVLEEIEESRAFFQVYEGAIYMHQGDTYLVKSLELTEKIAFCQRTNVKYYTKTRDYTDIHVIGGDLAYRPDMKSAYASAQTSALVNACKVTTNWFGFYRIWRTSNQIFDRVDLSLPSYSYESQAVWIQVPQSIKTAVQKNNLSFRAGLHAASHALLNVVPLYMMCNVSDLRTECANPHETRNIPERLLLYDQHPGGIGLSIQVQRLFPELLTAALELVSTCCCLHSAGCPNCVQLLSCGEYNEVLDKKSAIIILGGVIEAENLRFKSR